MSGIYFDANNPIHYILQSFCTDNYDFTECYTIKPQLYDVHARRYLWLQTEVRSDSK